VPLLYHKKFLEKGEGGRNDLILITVCKVHLSAGVRRARGAGAGNSEERGGSANKVELL